jgi:FemAB-related protein (PEP-CTERM system-associated)
VVKNIVIKTLSESEHQKWDEFVSHSNEATFFHRSGWKNVIERSFGHKTHYLYAEKNGEILGVLPLGHIKSFLFGNALVSSPFCVYGGVATQSDEARDKLYDAAIEIAQSLNVDHLELRNLKHRYRDWPTKDLYVTFRKQIDPDPDVNMKAIPRKQRAMVRKGIDAGLVSEVDEDINRFFDIYSISVRNHGTPVFSKRYFALLKKEFGKDCEITVITKNGVAVSAVMTFYFRDEVLPYYGGGTLEARNLKAFDFMYWEVMRRACENGMLIFDYGRSKKGTGSYSFKKNWGFIPEPLNYEYYLVKSKNIPDVNPLNPKYQYFINLWKKLPVPLTKIIGPTISKNLG